MVVGKENIGKEGDGMNPISIILLSIFVVAFGLVSKRLEKSIITPAIAFVLFGIFTGPQVLGIIDLASLKGFLHGFAQITLVLILFTDAAKMDISKAGREFSLAMRLLWIGMPLTMIVGAFIGAVMFPFLGFWGAAVLATILAPTDAALVQPVITNKNLPSHIRQTINIESGLNDGLALPFVLFTMACLGLASHEHPLDYWLVFLGKQIVLGPLVGLAAGFAGGKIVHVFLKKQWMNAGFQQISALAMAVMIYYLAEEIGGNGFLAVFCGGLIMSRTCTEVCGQMYEFMETQGLLLKLFIFFIFGNAVIGVSLGWINWQIILYGLLSLTVIRMMPVFIGLIKTGLSLKDKFVLGWLGPRGLTSNLFAFLVLERVDIPHHEIIFTVVVLTVFMSILLHGLTASPLSRWYIKSTIS